MPDSGYPDVGQTIHPDGTVTYDFSGHISAQGLDLLAGVEATPPNDRRIRWLRETDGSLVADLFSYDAGDSYNTLTLHAEPSSPDDKAIVRVSAGTPPDDASVTLVNGPINSVSAKAKNGGAVTLIDDNDLSSFLKVAGGVPRDRAINFGIASVEMTRIENDLSAGDVTVPHGLADGADFAVCAPVVGGDLLARIVSQADYDATNITLFAQSMDAFVDWTGSTTQIAWLAVAINF
jgi:hypothetical protein